MSLPALNVAYLQKCQEIIGDRPIQWMPIPKTSQVLALLSPANHTLYHGTRGGGKTTIQLMRFRRNVGIGYGARYSGVLFAKRFKDLADVINKSKMLFSGLGDGARFFSSATNMRWEWPSGEIFYFRHAEHPSQYEEFHGSDLQFIGWNELTLWKDDILYRKMTSCLRSGWLPHLHTPKDKQGEYLTLDRKPLKRPFLECFSTTNPSGIGHNWVKDAFITPVPDKKMRTSEYEVFNPRTRKADRVQMSNIAIFSMYRENYYLDPQYLAYLDELTANDPQLRAAWLEGSWDITSGGALDDVWNSSTHVMPRFKIPPGWYVDRAMDWGSAKPTAVLYFAESNGEDVTLEDGSTANFPSGTLFVIHEIYLAREKKDKGLGLSSSEVCQRMKDEEARLQEFKWVEGKPYPGPADNSIRSVIDVGTDSVANKMADCDVFWTPSDKSTGSRVIGLQLIRDRLKACDKGEGEGLYFFDHCVGCLRTLPSLPRDEKNPEDVDTEAEDHIYDALRYRVLAGKNRVAQDIEVQWMVSGY